jgi:hypothetical protein
MSSVARKDAESSVAKRSTDARDVSQAISPAENSSVNPRQAVAREPRTTVTNVLRPGNEAPRTLSKPEKSSSGLSASITKLSLEDRFTVEALDLAPALVTPATNFQNLYDQVLNYYLWRFTDIAYSHDSNIAFIAQIYPCASRVARVTINAVINKLIIGATQNGLPVGNFGNRSGPAKQYLFPSIAAAIIGAVGKTTPLWSGEQSFIPHMNNVVPQIDPRDPAQVAAAGAIVHIVNPHVFAPDAMTDKIVHRLCSTGEITLRAVDWKIPTGTPHWLTVRAVNAGRINVNVHADVHPNNFDPPNTVLSTLCSCTNLPVNQCRYALMRAVEESVLYSLLTEGFE